MKMSSYKENNETRFTAWVEANHTDEEEIEMDFDSDSDKTQDWQIVSTRRSPIPLFVPSPLDSTNPYSALFDEREEPTPSDDKSYKTTIKNIKFKNTINNIKEQKNR